MPIIALEIPESYDNITRPITVGMVEDLKTRLSLPKEVNIVFPGSVETLPQMGSALGESGHTPTFQYANRVKVDMEERYLEEGVLTTSVFRPDNNYLFYDEQLMVYLKPIYTRSEIELSFTLRTTKTLALKWRDHIRRRMTEQKQSLLHELIYHYSVPAAFHVILEEIYSKREAICGYGESLQEWLSRHYHKNLTVVTNQSGTRGLVTIPEKQIQVQGWFNFADHPQDVSLEKPGETWQVSFNYTFQYDKVTSIAMSYPIVVHNQLLDDYVLNFEKPYNPYEESRKPSFTGQLNQTFSYINYSTDNRYTGIVVPHYDDWRPYTTQQKSLPLFTSLISVDLEDPHLIVNLMDLGELQFSQSLLNFIYRHRKDILQYLSTPFIINFFKGKQLMDTKGLIIDKDLNLKSTTPLNPREVHHLQFSVITQLRFLNKKGIDSLLHDPEICIKVVDLIDYFYKPDGPFVSGIEQYQPKPAPNNPYRTHFDAGSVDPQGKREKYQRVDTGGGYDTLNRTEEVNGLIQPTDDNSAPLPLIKVSPLSQPKQSDQLKLLGGKVVSKTSFEHVITQLKGDINLHTLSNRLGMITVMRAGIITHNKGFYDQPSWYYTDEVNQ